MINGILYYEIRYTSHSPKVEKRKIGRPLHGYQNNLTVRLTYCLKITRIYTHIMKNKHIND